MKLRCGVWQLSIREEVWSPSKVKKEKLPKEIRELQKKYLAGELTFTEYTTLMDNYETIRTKQTNMALQDGQAWRPENQESLGGPKAS